MVRFGKWTAITDALVVFRREAANDFWFFHLDAKVILHKIDSRKDGQE